MKRLLDVVVVVDKLNALGIIRKDRLGFINKHIVSEMLPMSSFFERQYNSLICLNRYAELLDTLVDRFKADKDIVILWCVLRIYEDTGIDITQDNEFLNLMRNGECTSRRLHAIMQNYYNTSKRGIG